MGCTSSKLDDLPAVALCRERCAFLEAAIHQRYALAESHVAYTHSLRGIGHSLHLFINHHHRFVASGGATGADSPRLNLPPQRKGDLDDGDGATNSPKKTKLASSHHNHAHSGSGSDSGHLEFDSDSEDDEEEDDLDLDSLHHHSPQHHHHLGNFPIPESAPMGGYMEQPGYITRYPNPEMMGHLPPPYSDGGGSYMHMNYMKNKSMPPSVVYEQRPTSPQRVYIGESSSSYPYPPQNPYFGYSNPVPGDYGSSSSTTAAATKPPPPPPSPPRSNGWDFLNPFDTYYPPYTPSRDSRELREEEGIPDLEDDDSHYEVVKEVHGKPKFAGGGGNQPNPAAVHMMREESPSPPLDKSGASTSGGGDIGDASAYQSRPSVSVEKQGMEYEVHVVEKKVVEDEERRSNATATRGGGGGGGGGGPRAVPEVAKEIENQFVKAAESGSEIAKLLEVGKHPYGRKHVASKMLHGVTPSAVPSTSGVSSSSAAAVVPPTYADIEEELASRSRNLSSTLHKLHLWEKKLYHEVKAEEKLRLAHEKKLRKLKRLDERGAEAIKVDKTRRLVRDMSTKIRIAIQVVDKISVTINKIRDEDLWPQLNALIQGLTRMWTSMLECHQSQCQAIREAQGLGPIRASKKLGDEHLEATSLLGHELINWILGFSSWVSAQKGYVKELNKWLMKCLLYEPEETPDGIVPFSPGRIGAPPIFVICNQWSQALDRISEKEVIEAMRSFTTSVLQLWEQDRLDTMMTGHGDSEKKVRNMDREEQRIQREIQALEKKMILVAPGDGNSLSISGNIVYQSDTSSDSLQGSLQRIFEAMERFTAESMRAYEDLLKRTEEETAPRELEEEEE
ncbi:unnamed protein product [Arabidopsis lyrata]|uniref:uncharacterized protein LOC9303156 n=1 Tax=Arabidopsis lyrata subsp. lyrata TaxID=81972 RepID=UPI000A29DA04|nr:uncharacterized protein LOC9303156 [Arabidopsis lyrata subsp. lyrata]CAH8274261.1 unnamed protein product [Arabidopsis lyrata]|eukprot:XP_020873207.1 uncharacterized protein LOC9303156 [Arabidopsis lyrata subsp. lyrata]